jgi:SAM-dependent methyltransferase
MADTQTFVRKIREAGLIGKAEVVESSMISLLKKYGATGDICHLGSKLADGVEDTNYRRGCIEAFGGEYVGLDLFPGENVDVVADLCRPELEVEHPELIERFGTVVCSAVMEHVAQPFDAARNIVRLMRPGGLMYFAVPWVWGYHAVPDDFWRFSIAGVKKLFPDLVWKEWLYAGTGRSGLGIRAAPGVEKRLFAIPVVDGVASLVSDRGLPYLNIVGIAERPAYVQPSPSEPSARTRLFASRPAIGMQIAGIRWWGSIALAVRAMVSVNRSRRPICQHPAETYFVVRSGPGPPF